ncbi:phosphatase PAP2 family protein [Muricauda sp. CAU 1633]|uniref:phosphatase PAP2 family protein n=1 Tax=Allomuricauda sp. CAU 1633 TaxID=2816036 RepID=UPI001A8F24AC|nr:phosphatase PAP2 family protein [Muricauda sp. CAU 1633]MBO0324041.1 phosphatase PAP2 family protein [Muricauda sp. CAU 1633]
MRIVLQRLLPFFLILALLFPLTFYPKGEILLAINSLRTPFWDAFFIRASSLGNALTVALAVLLVLRFRFKWLAVFLLAFAFQVVLVLLFKKGLYRGELRPYLYFYRSGLGNLVHLVDGVKIRYVNSFPSGHTATIFYLVSFFALLSRNKTASWILMVLGLLVGLSRIYLVQHFFVDVYFGILFGAFSSVAAYLIVRRFPKRWHGKQIQINVQRIQQNTQNAFRQFFNG